MGMAHSPHLLIFVVTADIISIAMATTLAAEPAAASNRRQQQQQQKYQ
jgi:hypothetical protein